MKKFNFKDFKYELIDSSKKSYKEILVTYNVDGTTARQYLFVKESKGKGNDYYTNAAKKIIDERIKSGELAKATAKQLKFKGVKTGGALKPIMITLSCVLAAGAIGTGGYFTYKYFTSPGGDVPPGPGPSPVVTGYTVTLLPGEGSFKDGKPYLTYGNVEKGTELKSLTGYSYPTTVDNKDFNFWVNDKGEQFIDTSTVEADLVLTASFYEGVGYYKAFTQNEIQDKLGDLKEAGAKEDVTKPYEQILELVKQSFDKEGFITNVDQAKALKEFADITLDQILVTDAYDKTGVVNRFTRILNCVYSAKDSQILTYLKVGANCEKSITRHLSSKEAPDYLMNLFKEFDTYIKNDDGALTHILEIVAPIVMDATFNIFTLSKIDSNTIMGFLDEGVKAIHEYENLTDDQIKELGTLVGDRVAAIANYGNDVLIGDFYKSVFTSFDEALHAEQDKELKMANYKLRSEGMNVLTNIGNVGGSHFLGDCRRVVELIYDSNKDSGILKTFNDFYENHVITVDNIELATKFALLAIDATKNIGTNDHDNFGTCFSNLFSNYLDKDNVFKDVDLKTIECLAKLPNCEIQNATITKGLSNSFVDYIMTTRDEVINNIKSVHDEISIEIMKEIELGRLESAAYSPFFGLVTQSDSWIEDLKGAYETALNICRDGADESQRYYGSLLSGLFIGFSKELQYHLLNNDAQKTKVAFSGINIRNIIEAPSSFSDENKLVFNKYFASIMSNLPLRFRSFSIDDTSFLQYLNNEIQRLGAGFDNPQSLENFYKEFVKLYSCDYIFELDEQLTDYNQLFAKEIMRLKQLINNEMFVVLTSDRYPNKSRFNEIFETFDKELYSKVCCDMDINILSNFLTRVHQLVD